MSSVRSSSSNHYWRYNRVLPWIDKIENDTNMERCFKPRTNKTKSILDDRPILHLIYEILFNFIYNKTSIYFVTLIRNWNILNYTIIIVI